jgi:hypothetical protein
MPLSFHPTFDPAFRRPHRKPTAMFYASQSLMKYSNIVHGEHVDGDSLGT